MGSARRNMTRLAVVTALMALMVGFVSVGSAGAQDVYVTPESTVPPTDSVPVEVESSDLERPPEVLSSGASRSVSSVSNGGDAAGDSSAAGGAQVAGATQVRGSALAFTGSDAVATAVIGAAVLLLGGVMLLARRRSAAGD